ncbi:MAG: DNA-3-methyladenine glycosylase 2 family protein [Actinomycetota bacterium]
MADKSPAYLLAATDATFARLLDANGLPPQWRRSASFGTVIRLVLEQQVSLASAQAAYMRLVDRIGEPVPALFLTLGDADLKTIGFSRQKTRYARIIATRMLDGSLDLERVGASGEAGRAELLSVTGIGPWTVACYFLFVVGQDDIWPSGDRALYVSMARNLGLDDVPDAAVADSIAEAWSPWRSTAARMLWHDYLGGSAYVENPNAGFADETGIVSG